ncbi:hypothetical protein DZF95_03600 [Clavibacter michiganensis]|nr:hypothetical protein DZF95_03600 [Clavibacter michiganensis]
MTGAQLMRLAEAGERMIANSVVFNHSTPTGAVRRVADLHPDLRALAGGHPNAPSEWELNLLVRVVTPSALDVFFVEASATKAEKAKLYLRLQSKDDRTPRDVWLEVPPR